MHQPVLAQARDQRPCPLRAGGTHRQHARVACSAAARACAPASHAAPHRLRVRAGVGRSGAPEAGGGPGDQRQRGRPRAAALGDRRRGPGRSGRSRGGTAGGVEPAAQRRHLIGEGRLTPARRLELSWVYFDPGHGS
ncbi:hypothetical protein DVA67_000110 [Solirubrobacter sp. CPCC 204708]|nr:hypothetical protein [Solirubrobacter deserti]